MKSLDQYLSQEAPPRNGGSPYRAGAARSVGPPRRKRNTRSSSIKYNNPYLVHSDFLQDDYDCDTDSLMNDDSSTGIQSESDLFRNSTRRSYKMPTDQALLSDIKRRSTLAKQRRSTMQQKRPSRSQSSNKRHDDLLGDIKSQRRSTRMSTTIGGRNSVMVDHNASLLGDVPSSRRSTMRASRRRTTKRPESLESAMAELKLLGADLDREEDEPADTADMWATLPDLDPLMDFSGDDSSRLMDDSSRHQTHTFRPDESVSLLDIEENDLQALDFKSAETLPEMEQIEEEEPGQDSLTQFWNESVCRWHRNVDFLLKLSVGDHNLNIVGGQQE